ncbi:DNA polymerase [Caulobacter sp. D4A]|nr:DNA polymerase [Caulobacter sp. D4A]PXA96824.1 DNA polymerase [Caulobacter sp. D5]
MTVIHCVNVVDRLTGRRRRFNSGFYADGTPAPRAGTIEEGLVLLMEADCIGGHNVIGYDIPAIQKLYPWFEPKGKVRDSLVEARVIWTNLFDIDTNAIKKNKRPEEFIRDRLTGTHKLSAWGFRLGEYKGDYGPAKEAEARALGLEGDEIRNFVWGRFTPDMDEYCEQDVVVNVVLFDKIDSKGFSPDALELETAVAGIIRLQEKHGFLFDKVAADALLHVLQVRHAQLSDELRKVFLPWYAPKRKLGRHDLIDPARDNKKFGYVAGCKATRVELIVFNPGSRDHIADRMIKLFGWTPVELTETGKPKVDETTLDGLDYPEAKLLVEYLTVDKRIGQLATGKQAWLGHVRRDGRIHGRVNANGAVTGRMTHSSPNIAQVPKVGSLYGEACRALFIVAPGFKLVGCDAEGLELRMLGHYMARFDGGAYANTVANGRKEDGTDVHTVNQRLLGLNKRDNAKTWIYAYLYGAGNLKLGSIVYDDMSEARRAAFNARWAPGDPREKALARLGLKTRRSIEEGLPALGKLQDLIKDKAKRGYIKSLDGRELHVRSAHAALNTLLQGGGAVVMKKALVICFRAFTALGWVHGVDYGFCANVHDEFQIEVREELAQQAGQIAADSIAEAGVAFGLRCPLAGAFDIGDNWAETH